MTLKKHLLGLAAGFCLALLAAPAAAGPPEFQKTNVQIARIHVTSNGWHTGIVLDRATLPLGAIPEAEDFPNAAYLEFGWGDAEFYPAKEYTVGLAFGAALVPSAALMHVAGLPSPPAVIFPANETLAIDLSAVQFQKLLEFISASFARPNAVRGFAVAPGLYSFSKFYPATGEFHLFNNCNRWTARALAHAGLDVDAEWTLRAEGVMAQLRALKP